MSGIFMKLLSMSISAGWLIMIIVLIRFVFRKLPKWIYCLLWVLVAFRLVCPFSLESRFSLMPEAEMAGTVEYTGRPYIQSGITTVDNTVNTYLGEPYEGGAAQVKEPVKFVTNPINIISFIWLIGTLGFFAYALISYLHLQRRVSESARLRENIFLCDRIQTPFIMGIVKPRIFLPSDMNELQIENVIAHEQAHISRRDYIWKPFGFILLAVYWFNPLCYLAYILLCRDIEMACDEKVIRYMDADAKKEYTKVLLSCSVSGKKISVYPLAFGEVEVKERIKEILNYKKPTILILFVSVLVCVVAAFCFLTNPKSDPYEAKIWIPAHSEGFYYTEEEFSAHRRTISVEVGQEAGDTEVKIFPADGNKVKGTEKLIQVTPGLPYKVNVEEEAWFHVGVYANNESDEAVAVSVTVSNAECQIKMMQAYFVDVVTPTIDLAASTGVEGSTIYYADQEIFIFGGYYGLFVYDMTNHEIIRSVDLKALGYNMMAQDDAENDTDGIECEIISVTSKGTVVLLYPYPISRGFVYWYSVYSDEMRVEYASELRKSNLYHNQYVGEQEGKCASYEKDGETGYVMLVNDTTIGELGYILDGDMSTFHTIFEERQISYDNAFEIFDRVLVETGLENAYAWNNTADFKEDADILIKMAVDSTGEYEIYGISSAEYGDYGMLLNDIIAGEDNWNYVYEPWFYTGAPNDQPTLEWTDDGELIFSYICKDENGEETWYHRVVDCGYDTGHMELMP